MKFWHQTIETADRRAMEPLGVIDIGSNSVRLVVYDGAVRSPTPIFNEKVLCGLGRTVATEGKLAEDSVSRALEALRRFHAISMILGVKNLQAIATAAVREASNGAEFLTAAEEATGCKIDVLTGEREASLAAQGILMGFVSPDGIAGDLGGGSLEVIDITGKGLKDAATMPLGGLRLMDESGNKVDKAIDLVDQEISKLAWLKNGQNGTFYAVGGTWRSFAKMHMEANNYPLRVMHGYTIKGSDAAKYAEQVRSAKKLNDLPGYSAVSKARREALPFGALVLERLFKVMKPKEVVFSVFGIREGLIYDQLSRREKNRDPLLAACESVAASRSRSSVHANELRDWTDQLFNCSELEENDEDRRLRHAACLLSDSGWQGHPDYRGEHGMATIAHSNFPGIAHEGRALLALAIYYRHETSDHDADPLFSGLKKISSRRTQKRAQIIGSAVRAAHMLSVGRPGVVDETSLTYDGNKLILTLPPGYAGLDGERLRRRFGNLAALIDKDAVVQVES